MANCRHLNRYRLNDFSELDELKARLGEKLFYEIAREVYSKLDGMPPGSIFTYQKTFAGNRLEPFIKMACRYIVDHSDYTFSNDYGYIQRDNVTP
jgi:hypothetical protein